MWSNWIAMCSTSDWHLSPEYDYKLLTHSSLHLPTTLCLLKWWSLSWRKVTLATRFLRFSKHLVVTQLLILNRRMYRLLMWSSSDELTGRLCHLLLTLSPEFFILKGSTVLYSFASVFGGFMLTSDGVTPFIKTNKSLTYKSIFPRELYKPHKIKKFRWYEKT